MESQDRGWPLGGAAKFERLRLRRREPRLPYFNVRTLYRGAVILMAHPEQFEGRDVEFRAWARVASDATLLFPTKEAMDDSESVSSVVVYGEAMAPDLLQRARVARVIVRGRFYLSEGKAHSLDAERLGVLQNAVILP